MVSKIHRVQLHNTYLTLFCRFFWWGCIIAVVSVHLTLRIGLTLLVGACWILILVILIGFFLADSGILDFLASANCLQLLFFLLLVFFVALIFFPLPIRCYLKWWFDGFGKVNFGWTVWRWFRWQEIWMEVQVCSIVKFSMPHQRDIVDIVIIWRSGYSRSWVIFIFEMKNFEWSLKALQSIIKLYLDCEGSNIQ
jgi:hypothetical protein